MSGRCCSHGAAVAATAAALRWWLSTATIARISGEPHNCIVLPSLETHFSVSLDIYLLGKYTVYTLVNSLLLTLDQNIPKHRRGSHDLTFASKE